MTTTDMEASNTLEGMECTDCPIPLQIEGLDKQVQETRDHITGSTSEASYPPGYLDYQIFISTAEQQKNIGHKEVTVVEEPESKLSDPNKELNGLITH